MSRSVRVARSAASAHAEHQPLAIERVVTFFAALALIGSVLVPPSAFAGTRNWSLTRAPSSVTGPSASVQVTATNTGDDGGSEAVGCVVIAVPNAGFTVSGAVIDLVSDGDSWSVSSTVGATETIVAIVSDSGGGNRLHADEWVSATISVDTTGPDGTYTWTANAYNKEDCTDDFLLTRSITVTVNGAAPNAAPAASDDTYTTAKNVMLGEVAPGVLGNDLDPDGDPLTAVTGVGPTNGSLTLNGDGSFSYVPDPGFVGTDSFTYTATDGSLVSAAATVTIDVTNTPPVAGDDAYATLLGLPLVVGAPGVLADDTDADGDALTAVVVTDPAHGSLTLDADGSFTYVPDLLYVGPDSFTYRASDGIDGAVATVTINVTNTAPSAADDGPYLVDEDDVLTVPATGVLGNDTDADGDPLSATLVTDVAFGTLTLNADGSFDYAPDPDTNGTDTFVYRANDPVAASADATVTITIAPVNDDPVAADDLFTLAEDAVLSVAAASGLVANDGDVDGDPLTVGVLDGADHGTLTIGADGAVTYAPDADYHGPDAFTYVLDDGQGGSAVGNVTLDVTAVNDAPTAVGDAAATAHGTPIKVDVVDNDTDVDGDALVLASVGTPSAGSAAIVGGKLRYTPIPGFVGDATIPYSVTDGIETDDGVLTVTVGPEPTPSPTPTPNPSPDPSSEPTAPPTGSPSPVATPEEPPSSAAPTASPTDEPPTPEPSATPSPAGSAGPTPGATAPPSTPASIEPLAAPELTAAGFSGTSDFGAFGGLFGGFGDGFALALSAAIGVPGLLFMVVVAVQVLGAAAWIPTIRRTLAGVGIKRRRRTAQR